MGFGYVEDEAGVTADFVKAGNFEIQVAGACYSAKASLRSMYDPQNLRVRT
jgi:4-methylaminobutanoate oxidase (formaldehyde-forming)